MTDALLTDQEIAILCDVLDGWGGSLKADRRNVLDQLIAKGFVVAGDQDSPGNYKLTGKAQQLLAERGVPARTGCGKRVIVVALPSNPAPAFEPPRPVRGLVFQQSIPKM